MTTRIFAGLFAAALLIAPLPAQTADPNTLLQSAIKKELVDRGEALDTMIEVMNRLALDGRDPNSYSGYAWTLGRYDRPWGPERPVFGTVRYMSSANTAKKLRLKEYLRTWSVGP